METSKLISTSRELVIDSVDVSSRIAEVVGAYRERNFIGAQETLGHLHWDALTCGLVDKQLATMVRRMDVTMRQWKAFKERLCIESSGSGGPTTDTPTTSNGCGGDQSMEVGSE
jgi:hypothetical protein